MAGFWAALGQTAGNSAAGAAGNSVGSFMGDASDWITNIATGGAWNKLKNKNFQKSREQQKQLNEDTANINFMFNEKAADAAAKRSMDIYEKYESYGAQKKQMEKAGLNPALMYGMGGTSGQNVSQQAQGGGANGAASSGSAAQFMMAEAQRDAIQLEQMKVMAEIKNIEADTNEKEAGAKNLSANTMTTDQIRDKVIDKLEAEVEESYQRGRGYWIENGFNMALNELSDDEEGVISIRSKFYGETAVNTSSTTWKRERLENLEKVSRKDLNEATAYLNTERGKTAFGELMAAMKQADAAAVRAAAEKLTSEFHTGEFVNWKTWVDIGLAGAGAVGDIIKALYSPTKNIVAEKKVTLPKIRK